MAGRRRAEPPGYVCLGVVTGARGLRGEVKVKTFTGDPSDIGAYGPVVDQPGGPERTFTVVGPAGGRVPDVVVARVAGVMDRTAAEGLKGFHLLVPRSALPAPEEDTFYNADLIGLRAERTDGRPLGRIRDVVDHGAGPVLDLGGGPDGTLMVPFTRAAVPVVDLAGGRVVIDPPPGLLEPAPPEAHATAHGEDGGGTEEVEGDPA